MCEFDRARISALIDDELTDAERAEVLEHLAQCPACKTYWEELLLLRCALCEEVSAPSGFADAVMSRVRSSAQEKPERKVLRFPGWKRFAALAACCAIALLGVWAMELSPEIMGSRMEDAALRNGAAPQMFAENSASGGAPEAYGLDTASRTDDAAADCGAPEADHSPAEAPESSRETDDADTGAAECTAAAVLTTDSELAQQWVEENLGKPWESGESYALSEEQYNSLRSKLQDAGEQFSEIMGDANRGSYHLFAE